MKQDELSTEVKHHESKNIYRSKEEHTHLNNQPAKIESETTMAPDPNYKIPASIPLKYTKIYQYEQYNLAGMKFTRLPSHRENRAHSTETRNTDDKVALKTSSVAWMM